MKCLLKYHWIKLPRAILPQGKGVMGQWARLAAKAAFRSGNAKYCGHINAVSAGSWAGGIVGVKSILGLKNRQHAFDALNTLDELELTSFTYDDKTKKLVYTINDYVLKCTGSACSDGAVYATDEYGFLCLPRSITQRLVDRHHIFEDSDAWLDLWCHTVYQDSRNAFSTIAPVIQYGKYGAALTLEKLGARWGWEKTKVWRFFQRHLDTFALYKLPGSYGCLVFNTLYPTDMIYTAPASEEIMQILGKICILGENTDFKGTDNERINRNIAWYSAQALTMLSEDQSAHEEENRVALLAPITRAYFSLWNCKNCLYDCGVSNTATPAQSNIRGPCARLND